MSDPTPESGQPEAPKARPRRRRPWWVAVVLAGLAAFFALRACRARRAGPPPAPEAVPVVAVQVERRDVPIYLAGLGTVQALNTVTVRARVDGAITEIRYREGQDVREGDVLLRIDPAPFEAQLAQAIAKKLQDEAQLANARVDLARNRDLYRTRVIAQQQYDTQRSQVAQFEALVAADEAAIVNQRVQLGYTTISAPIAGRVGLRLVDKGNLVRASDATGLLVITQLQPISLLFTLPERHLYEIQRQRREGELTVQALEREETGRPISSGTLSVIDNQIDTATGTIRLKATFPNEDLRLWPGQFVNARLLLATRKNGLTVPAAVVQRGPKGSYAFVIGAGDKVAVKPVRVAQVQDGVALLEEGALREGERVVLEGQFRLQEGTPVKIVQTSPGGTREAQGP